MKTFEDIAREHCCTIKDVRDAGDMMHFNWRQDMDVIMEWLELYGSLRDLGFSHAKLMKNFGVVLGTKQVLELKNPQRPEEFRRRLKFRKQHCN
jgi:hypothetical protein